MTAIATTRARAFTLVETLVAVAILMIAIVAPFTAAQRALDASYTARDQLIAASLAQEGLEYVREIRDNNYLASPSNYDPFSGIDSSPNCITNFCVVDPTVFFNGSGTTVKACTSDCSDQPLYLSSAGIYNQHNDGTKTTFVRSIKLEPNPASSPYTDRVTVLVSWTTHGKAYSMSVAEDFYKWL